LVWITKCTVLYAMGIIFTRISSWNITS